MIDALINFDINTMYPEIMHMTIDKGKICVRKGYKEEWVIYLPYSQNKEIIEWCRETFGESGRDRKYRWRANWSEQSTSYPLNTHGPRIFLRRECDVTLFNLRWQ